MGSPVVGDDFQAVSTATGICEGFKRLLRIPGQLNLLFNWLFDGDGELSSEASDGIADYLHPIGGILLWPGSTLPSNKWLICNGQLVSRTDYATLFQRIGTTYGAGDGSSTFALPDLQGRVPRGVSSTDGLGVTGGADTLTLNENQIPLKTHYHGVGEDPGGDEIQIIKRAWASDGTFDVLQNSADNPNVTTTVTDSGALATTNAIEVTGSEEASQTIDNRPAFIGLYFIIKAK